MSASCRKLLKVCLFTFAKGLPYMKNDRRRARAIAIAASEKTSQQQLIRFALFTAATSVVIALLVHLAA